VYGRTRWARAIISAVIYWVLWALPRRTGEWRRRRKSAVANRHWGQNLQSRTRWILAYRLSGNTARTTEVNFVPRITSGQAVVPQDFSSARESRRVAARPLPTQRNNYSRQSLRARPRPQRKISNSVLRGPVESYGKDIRAGELRERKVSVSDK